MSNKEKVARQDLAAEAIFGVLMAVDRCTEDPNVIAHGGAINAIDALADVDALTSVIDLHVFDRQPDGSLTCIYDDENTTEDYVGAHIAAAVVAWMKDAL